MTPAKTAISVNPAPDRVVWRVVVADSGRIVPVTLARVAGVETPYQRGHVMRTCGGRYRAVGGRA